MQKRVIQGKERLEIQEKSSLEVKKTVKKCYMTIATQEIQKANYPD